MTNHSHRVASATNFVVAAPTSSNLRSSSACPVTASNGAQRPVHTTLIDEAWDLQPTAASTSQSGARRIGASPPRTSLIDAEWDQADDERAAHLSDPNKLSRVSRTRRSSTPSGISKVLVPPMKMRRSRVRCNRRSSI